MPSPLIRIRGLSKTFTRGDGARVTAIDDIELDVLEGELLVLLGPSGCGKTTLLRTIAGLERADSGSISIGSDVVFDSRKGIRVPPERRPASMIFQSYALWPHMNVYENVAYPLRSRKTPRATISERVGRVLSVVGLERLATEYPAQLSGGQQQRVALARALVAGDGTILFDEPLSNVDAKVREQLRGELAAMQRELGFTAVYVTHDQNEAMALADRIAVLREGCIAQLGTPTEIYRQPADRYVAGFVGTINELQGTISTRKGTRVTVQTAWGSVEADTDEHTAAEDPVLLLSRPEDWRLLAAEANSGWPATLEASAYFGSYVEYDVRRGDDLVRVTVAGARHRVPAGTDVRISIDPTDLRIMPVES